MLACVLPCLALLCHTSHSILNCVEYVVAFIVIIVDVVFIRYICCCSCPTGIENKARDETERAAWQLDVTTTTTTITTKSIGKSHFIWHKEFLSNVTFLCKASILGVLSLCDIQRKSHSKKRLRRIKRQVGVFLSWFFFVFSSLFNIYIYKFILPQKVFVQKQS